MASALRFAGTAQARPTGRLKTTICTAESRLARHVACVLLASGERQPVLAGRHSDDALEHLAEEIRVGDPDTSPDLFDRQRAVSEQAARVLAPQRAQVARRSETEHGPHASAQQRIARTEPPRETLEVDRLCDVLVAVADDAPDLRIARLSPSSLCGQLDPTSHRAGAIDDRQA